MCSPQKGLYCWHCCANYICTLPCQAHNAHCCCVPVCIARPQSLAVCQQRKPQPQPASTLTMLWPTISKSNPGCCFRQPITLQAEVSSKQHYSVTALLQCVHRTSAHQEWSQHAANIPTSLQQCAPSPCPLVLQQPVGSLPHSPVRSTPGRVGRGGDGCCHATQVCQEVMDVMCACRTPTPIHTAPHGSAL